MYYLNYVLPVQELVFQGMKTYDHPMVTYCKLTTDCGPFQMFWEFTVKQYNDPTAQQQFWFPLIKAAVVCGNWTVIASIGSLPLMIDSIGWFVKADGTLTQQKTEYQNVQAQYSVAEEVVEWITS